MKPRYDVLIVGAGMAGISTALTLAHRNLSILMVDENPHTGGQLLRKTEGKKRFSPDRMKARGLALADQVRKLATDPLSGIEILSRAQVMGIFQDNFVQILHGNRIHEVTAGHVVLATGARERYLPFKGWTLPGVMSLGAAQILMKSSGVLPARQTLVGGTSPLQLALAWEILSNGGGVPTVLDQNSLLQNLGFLPLVKAHWPKAVEGAAYTARLALSGTRIRRGVKIMEARGGSELESIVIAKVNARGQAQEGTEKILPARALAVGHGFVPNVELASQAGCALVHDPELGGWVAEVAKDLTTSNPHILAVGEVTGIAGVKKSHVQGRLAGISLLEKLDRPAPGEREGMEKDKQELLAAQAAQMAYARFLNRLCRVPVESYAEIQDETVICRCEGITMGLLRQRVAQGFDTPTALKRSSRTGMGRCQGRICSPIIQDILAALKPETADGNPMAGAAPSLRSPVKNSPVRAYIGEA